jgi:hypothetical protein
MHTRSKICCGGSMRNDSSIAVGTSDRSARSASYRSGRCASRHIRLPIRLVVVSLPAANIVLAESTSSRSV